MTTFEYTAAENDINSSLVKDVYYNADTREAVLNLHGWAYKYSNVGVFDYTDLISAPSVGSAYADFKSDFGPAEALGWASDVDFKSVKLEVSKVGAPQNWSLASDAVVTDNTATTAPVTFNLAPVATIAEAKTYDYTLNFNVEGGAQDKSYNTKAVGVEQAIEQLTEVADMLDITIKVTSATVYFD